MNEIEDVEKLEEESAPEDVEKAQLVIFNRGDIRFGMPMAAIQRVQRLEALTPVPRSEPALMGITGYVGGVLPVFDLQRLWDLEDCGVRDLPFLIIVDDPVAPLGLLGESVDSVTDYYEESMNSLLPCPIDRLEQHVQGVLEPDIFIIDIAALLSHQATFCGDAEPRIKK